MLSGLPAFLVDDGGLNSGFMLVQYTAAALVSENKVLCHPASIDSIPTSANKEDHVSMGTISARKCRDIASNTEDVIAIELLCAAQALDLFTNMKPGEGTLAAYRGASIGGFPYLIARPARCTLEMFSLSFLNCAKMILSPLFS
jgi:histidine ammonia-lyase